MRVTIPLHESGARRKVDNGARRSPGDSPAARERGRAVPRGSSAGGAPTARPVCSSFLQPVRVDICQRARPRVENPEKYGGEHARMAVRFGHLVIGE